MSLLTTLPSPLPDTPSHLRRPDWPCTLMPLRCQIGHFLVFLPFFPQLTKNSSSVILQGLTQESLPLESLPAIAKTVFFLFRERGRGREILVWERNINQYSLTCAPSRDQTCNPGMCPDLESNQWSFTLRDAAQPTEPHKSEQLLRFLFLITTRWWTTWA